MRIVFMGTPEFARPVLQRVSANHEVALVVTQPDRPQGRSGQPAALPVKRLATSLGLPTIQPHSLRSASVAEQIRATAPDAIVVAAFGQILPRDVLAIPRYGSLNVHASLLPRYRGASPIAAAILNGDLESGVTIMVMEPGLDTGPILAQRSEPVHPDDTTASLCARLAELGAELVVQVVQPWAAGLLQPRPQDEALASYAPPLRKEQGAIDWSRAAVDVARQCRAYYPWPGCFTHWHGRLLKLLSVRAVDFDKGAPPGEVYATQEGDMAVVAGVGAVEVQLLQMAGKRPVTGADFLRGQRDIVGAVLQ